RAERPARLARPGVDVRLALARERVEELEEEAPGRERAGLAAIDDERALHAIGREREISAREDGEALAERRVRDRGDPGAREAHSAAERDLRHEPLQRRVH